MLYRSVLVTACLIFCAAGCSDGTSDTAYADRATARVKDWIASELDALYDAAQRLQDNAPLPERSGWTLPAHHDAIEAMRAEWKATRIAYEHIEGAIAVLFPDLDAAIDERYDGFLADGPDDYLFDGTGVTGMHAIERILWAGEHPPQVVAFEQTLPGYQPATFPATPTDAAMFRNSLAARLILDIGTMREAFAPVALDPATAFRGIIGSIEEQAEKVALNASGEAESRYARHTLADMRANLDGARTVVMLFAEWIEARDADGTLLPAIQAKLDALAAAYNTHGEGDALPAVPETWDPTAPSPEDLQSDYGQLWELLQQETDPLRPDSLVALLEEAATLLGIPTLP